MDSQTRYAVTDTRTEDEPACPTWVLAGDDPYAPIGLRAYAAAALATGEVDGDYVERAYEVAGQMDGWFTRNGPGPGTPPAPTAQPVPADDDPLPPVQIVEVD